MTLIEAITRVLRQNGLIRGDTDAPTSLTGLQHGASVQIAQIAIQDEIYQLTSDSLLDYEYTSSTITWAASTRTYALASNFLRMYGKGRFYDATGNHVYYEYRGGQIALRDDILNYKTQFGTPSAWYWEPGTTKQVGFFPVPGSSAAGTVVTYEFEGTITLTSASDTMPFPTAMEAETFCRLAARRFKYIYENLNISDMRADAEYMSAAATLAALLRPTNSPRRRGPILA